MNMYSLLRHETASAWMAWDCAVSLRDRSFRQRGRAREVDDGTAECHVSGRLGVWPDGEGPVQLLVLLSSALKRTRAPGAGYPCR